MDTRLLDQVRMALKAQQETIERQQQMLDDQERYMRQQIRQKDQDIAALTASLNKLAQTKTRELERLPLLFKQLQNTMVEQTNVFNGWMQHRQNHVTAQSTLITELLALGNVQMQLVAQLKTYQCAIIPPDYLKGDMTQLESDTARLEEALSKVAHLQSDIEQSQIKIIDSQTEIQTELQELDKLLNR